MDDTHSSFFIDRSGRIHMTAAPVTGIAQGALENLCCHGEEITLLLIKQNGIIKLFLLPDERSQEALRAEGILMGQPGDFLLEPGIRIARSLDRGIQPGSASAAIRTMIHDFNVSNLNIALDAKEYLLIRLTPFHARPWIRLIDECNSFFLKEATFCVQIIASGRVADAVCHDFSKSGCAFNRMEDAPDYLPAEPHYIDQNTMTVSEAQLVCRALTDLVLLSMAPTPTLEAPGFISEGLASAELPLGTVNGVPVGLPLRKLLNGTTVVGLNGSGKTFLLGRMIRPLHQRDIPVLVIAPIKHDFSQLFSYADIYRSGDPEHPLCFNLLDLPNDGCEARIATRILSTLVNTGGSDSVLPTILTNACQTLFASDLKETDLSALTTMVRLELASSTYADETKRALLQAALTRLKSLYLEPTFHCSESKLNIESLFHKGQLTVIELNALEPSFRAATATIILENIIRHARAMGSTTGEYRLIIFIDELHCLLNEGNSSDDIFRHTLEDAVNTLRANGVGFVLADQRLNLIGSIAEDGCANHIFLQSRASERTADLLCLDVDSPMMRGLPYLKQGDMLFHVSGERCVALTRISDADDAPEPTPPKDPEERCWCPYAACRRTCSSCDQRVHKICSDAAIQVLGDGASYSTYRNEILLAMKLDEKERKQACGLAYRHLEGIVMDTAMEKYKQAGMALTDTVRLAILRNCLRHELQRQLKFKAQ